jgi:hypothetical protein
VRGQDVDVRSVAAGLGGRPITERSLADILRKAHRGELEELTFMDLRTDVIAKAV